MMMFQRHLLQKHASNLTRKKVVPEQWLRIVVGTFNHTTTTSTTNMMSTLSTLTPAEQQFVQENIMDERGLVQFDTLHNMQIRSCRAYADKDLFSTYSTTTQNFEWMSFAECKLWLYCVHMCMYTSRGLALSSRISYMCFLFHYDFVKKQRRIKSRSMSCGIT